MGAIRMQAMWAVAVGAAMALSGCSCSQPVEECGTPAVTFLAPADGDTVGLKADVSVSGADSKGAPMDLDSAKLEVKQPGEADFGHLTQGDLSGAQASFPQVALGAGENQLRATVVKKGLSSCTATATITVTAKDTVPAPKVTQVTFPQDQNSDGVLNGLELPRGTKLQVKVKVKDGSGSKVQVKRGTAVVGTAVDVAAGEAVVPLDQLPEEDTGNYDFFAEVLKGGVAQNTPGTNPEASASIRLNRVAPSCTNTTRAVMGPSQDADAALAGFQLRGTGTVGATVASAVFRISGVGQSAASTPAAGAVSGDITVTAAGDTTYSVELVATDADGNQCTDAKMVEVDLVAPTLTISSPVAVDGGNAQVSTTPLAVNVVVSGVNDGTQVCVTRKQGTAAPVQVDCAPVTGGLVVLNVPFGSSGTYTITVNVTDAAGNGASASVTVDVALTVCPLVFTKPGACPGMILAKDLFTGNYAAEVQSTGCAGHNTRMYLGSSTTPLCSQQLASTEKLLCNIPVTAGTYTFRAEIDNTTGGPTSVSCDVTVDTSTPVLVFPNGASASNPSVINAVQDTQPAVSGAQAYLNFTATVATGGHVDVCIDKPLAPASSPCADGASGWYQLATGVTSPDLGFTYPEGEYQAKVVVIQGATANVSAPAFVRVDVTLPCVTSSGLSLPQDVNADAMLNAAELDGGMPRITFTQGSGCLDPATAPNPTVRVLPVVGSTVQTTPFNVTADVTFAPSNGPIGVNLSQNISAEADYIFFVQLTDWVGNVNQYAAGTPAARSVRIDRVAPSCVITRPAKSSPLNATDVPGGAFAASVSTSSDGTPVAMWLTSGATTLTQIGTQPAAPSYASAATFTLSGDSTWNLVATCNDAAGNQATAAKSWRVDLTPPTCTFTKPAAGTYTTIPVVTNVSASGQTGNVQLSSSISGALAPIAANSDVGLNLANGTHTLTATVTDDTGNTSTCLASNVVVNATNCDLALPNLHSGAGMSWVNTTNSSPASGGASITLQVSSTQCANSPVTVTKGATVVQSGTTNATGTVSFPMTVADGDSYSVTITNTSTSVTTTLSFGVDLMPPTFSSVTLGGAAPTGTPLFLVAATDNPKAGANGYYADNDAATTDGQINFAATITSSLPGAASTAAGVIDVLYGGASLVTQIPISSVPFSLSLAPLTFAHNTTGTFLVRATDQAGNAVVVYTAPMTVDVVAPGVLTTTIAAPSAVRTATVDVSWTASNDDGTSSASGPVTNYDLRWTTSSMPGHSNLTVAADWASSAMIKEALLPSNVLTKTLHPPPLNTYYATVRAVDEVGNYSPFAVGAARANMGTMVTLTAPVVNAGFGLGVASGASLNNDTLPDLVVAAPLRASNTGSVYIYFGASGFSDQTTCTLPSCQELTPYDGLPGLFGHDISTAGNVGDVANEKKADLVLVQDGWNGYQGRAFIYFGSGTTATLDSTTFIEIRGNPTFTTNPWQAARILPDLNGDGLDEFAIAVRNGGPGAVYVFKGRSVAAWQAAETQTDAVTSRKYVSIDAADWVIRGPASYVAPNHSRFGMFGGGLVGLGDFGGDGGVPGVAVPMSLPTINAYTLFAGSDVIASSPGAPVTMGMALQTLSIAPGTGGNLLDGLGANAVGGRNIINTTKPDLVLSSAQANSVLIFADIGASGFAGAAPFSTLVGPTRFGTSLAAGDVDGDGFADLLVGQSVATNPTGFVLYQRANAFDTPVGGSNQKLWVSKFVGGSSSDLGLFSCVIDIDGDGSQDVVLSDEINNLVRIYR